MKEYRDIKDIAALVRTNLKREFPACTFAVRIERYSMGQSMHVALTKAPFEVFASDVDVNGNRRTRDYAQLNEFQLRDAYAAEDKICNGTYLTTDAWNTMVRVEQIVNTENWDNSDSQTDYFDVNYYTHFAIGRWDKPFEVVEEKAQAVASPEPLTEETTTILPRAVASSDQNKPLRLVPQVYGLIS
jgi:hypothetical protein